MDFFRRIVFLIVFVSLLSLLTGCASSQKKTGEDLNSYSKGLSKNPDALKFFMIAQRLNSNPRTVDRAIEFYTEAIKIDPDFSAALSGRGFAYIKKNKTEMALIDLNRSVEADRNFPIAYGNRGYLYFKQKKYKKAVKDFTKSIDLNSKLSFPHVFRGHSYYIMKEYRKALEDYNEAVDLNVNIFSVYFNRGLIYLIQNTGDKGEKDFLKALELNPGSESSLYNLACIYSINKDYKKTLIYLNRSIKEGFKNIEHLKRDPDLINFRKSKEYKTFLNSIKK